MPMIEDLFSWAALVVEAAGVAIIILGAAIAMLMFGHRLRGGQPVESAYHSLRADLGRAILLGLEFLVGADIISTVSIDPTLRSVLVLGAIVLIRTFLSFTIELEISGRWPWMKREGPR